MDNNKLQIDVFIAYSRKDTLYLEELRKHLILLQRSKTIKIWYDGEIVPGTVWEKDIKKHLHNADIVLLLISADSLNSKYFYDKEMTDALERHHREETIVVPVILKDCTWELSDLKDLQVLPKDGKPIKNWPDESSAYANIVRGLYKSIDEVKRRRKVLAKAQAVEKQKKQEEKEQQRQLAEQKKRAQEEQKRLLALEKSNAENAKQEQEKLEKEKAQQLEAQRLKRLQAEEVDWTKLQKNESSTSLKAFLKNYPQSKFGQDAKARLSSLNKAKKEKQSAWLKKYGRWIGLVFLLVFVIWIILMLIRNKNNNLTEVLNIGPSVEMLVTYRDQNTLVRNWIVPDSNILKDFDFKMIKGVGPSEILSIPGQVIITKNLANTLFGGIDPIGKVIKDQNGFNFTIAGLIESAPRKSNIQFDALASSTSTENQTQNSPLVFGTFTDSRDSQSYKWVQLKDGNKWMAENLNYETVDSWCHGNREASCDSWGRLYIWEAAKKACPFGWRLPSDEDWQKMINYYINPDDVGISVVYQAKEKAAYRALTITGYSGFSANTIGHRYVNGTFYGQGGYWSSTDEDFDVWVYKLDKESGILWRHKANKSIAYSCRCIKSDESETELKSSNPIPEKEEPVEKTKTAKEIITEGGNDERAWESATKQNTISAYKNYQQKHPQGKYYQEAGNRISNLEEVKKQAGKASTTTGTLTDSRDGQTYKWVRLKDGKKWMAENLNYKTTNSWCYDDKKMNCDKYGRLYTWEAAKKACPSGWRLPSDDEWRNMTSYYGKAWDLNKNNGEDAGKSAYKALIDSGSGGFSALLGGGRFKNSGSFIFIDLDSEGSFWTAAEWSIDIFASRYSFNKNSGKVGFSNIGSSVGLSCRCIKD